MFKNIKLNRDYWKKRIPRLKYGVPNPLLVFTEDEAKFSEAMTSFRFASVFKTTGAGRHQQTQAFLKQNINTNHVILDIGASDGSTSLYFIELLKLSFKKYYVTDYNINCTYNTYDGYTYFFNASNTCFLIASEKFVFYPDNNWLVNVLFKQKINTQKRKNKSELLFSNRRLLQVRKLDARIIIQPYNIFEPWQKEKADIIIVGNLLNRAYFSENEIYTAMSNCYSALSDQGLMAIIRNQLTHNNEIEHANVYRKNINSQSFTNVYEVEGGVEINDFILSLRFS